MPTPKKAPQVPGDPERYGSTEMLPPRNGFAETRPYHGNASVDFERVLMRMKSLEESLLKHSDCTRIVHDELARTISKQVVEQLRLHTLPLSLASTSAAARPVGRGGGRNKCDFGPVTATVANAKKPDGDFEPTPDPMCNNQEFDLPRSVSFGSVSKTRYPDETDASEDEEEQSEETVIGTDQEASMSQATSGFHKLETLRNSVRDAQLSAHHIKMEKLRHAVEFSEQSVVDAANKPKKSMKDVFIEADVSKKDNCLDLTVATIIVLNAMVIGISLDYQHELWSIIDTCFSICFLFEFAMKLHLHGVIGHFSQVSNCLDFILVLLDVTQMFLDKVMRTKAFDNTPSASIFRVVRLARLARLIRLARLRVFDELVAMITGLVGGMTTLMWSVVFFALIVYITSLLFREFYGNREVDCEGEDIKRYFDSVPRSMLTVFRYFFGDFSTIRGTNLFEAIQQEYGTLNGVFVSLLFFVITIGLFNVIAAIFVESTLEAAFAMQRTRRTERLNDDLLWGTNISMLVRKLFEYNDCKVGNDLSNNLWEFADMPISEKTFTEYLKDEEVHKALSNLEIGEEDHKYLFDILDSDNTGSILVSQLSDGVERLRGDPRRSDIICLDLMVRSIQEQANFLVKAQQTSLDLLVTIKRYARQVAVQMAPEMEPFSVLAQDERWHQPLLKVQ